MELHMTEQEIHHALDPVENVTRRQVIGGPSPARVQEMIDKGHGAVERFEADWRSKRAYLDEKPGGPLRHGWKAGGGGVTWSCSG